MTRSVQNSGFNGFFLPILKSNKLDYTRRAGGPKGWLRTTDVTDLETIVITLFHVTNPGQRDGYHFWTVFGPFLDPDIFWLRATFRFLVTKSVERDNGRTHGRTNKHRIFRPLYTIGPSGNKSDDSESTRMYKISDLHCKINGNRWSEQGSPFHLVYFRDL